MAKTVMPDLFVLDYQLPGIDGLELVDRFQAVEALRQVPILFMLVQIIFSPFAL